MPTLKNYFPIYILERTEYKKDLKKKKKKPHPLPWKASCIFVLVLVSQATCGLDVEMSVQLINEHKVEVKFLAVELQTQVSKPFHLQQRAFQGLHS